MENNKFIEIKNGIVHSTIKLNHEFNNISELIFKKNDLNPDRCAFVDCETDEKWTWSVARKIIINIANHFIDYGIVKGDTVSFCCPNAGLHAMMLIALTSIGGVYSGCKYGNPFREIYNLVTDANGKFFVTTKANIAICEKLIQETKIEKIFIIDAVQDEIGDVFKSVQSLLDYEKLSAEDSERRFFTYMSKLNKDDRLLITFSSGTTGKPKAVPKSHSKLFAVTALSCEGFEVIIESDNVAITSPFNHSGGFSMLMLTLLIGATAHFVAQFNAVTLIDFIIKYKLSSMFIVPSTVIALNNAFAKHVHGEIPQIRITIVAGEVLHCKPAEKFIKLFKPIYFGQSFGSAEVGFATCKPYKYRNDYIQSNGYPIGEYKVKISDLITDVTKAFNEVGEIRIKGPQVLDEYLNNEQATNELFDKDGFYKTGDSGYLTADGHLIYKERFKEILKCMGCQVSPAELETVLLTHESVKEAAIIGVPNYELGSLPKAFVILNDEWKNKISEDDLINYVNNQVAEYKKLRGGLVIMEHFPRTVISKIDRKQLRSLS